MRRKYQQPQTVAVLLQGQVHLMSGSNQVNDYQKGSDINVGDDDD